MKNKSVTEHRTFLSIYESVTEHRTFLSIYESATEHRTFLSIYESATERSRGYNSNPPFSNKFSKEKRYSSKTTNSLSQLVIIQS